MNSSLRQLVEQLAQHPDVPPSVSGSPADLELTVPRGIRLHFPISAIKALRDSGLRLIDAKRAYERLLADCELRIHLPGVVDLPALQRELAGYGITATVVQHAPV